jgi:hypothetical protein
MAEQQSQSPQAPDSGETLLFDAGGMSPTRIVSIVALAFALGSFVLAGMLYVGSGAPDSHISATERSVWAGLVLVVFFGFLTAVAMYQRRIAHRITLMSDGLHLRITTPTLFGSADDEIAIDDLMVANYHDGDRAGEESSNQPWVWLQVRNSHSYVVPLSGKIPNKGRLLQVLSVER